ncbi:hypothetical protein GGI43DRAFT_233267 [Trichoderma evansii]
MLAMGWDRMGCCCVYCTTASCGVSCALSLSLSLVMCEHVPDTRIQCLDKYRLLLMARRKCCSTSAGYGIRA